MLFPAVADVFGTLAGSVHHALMSVSTDGQKAAMLLPSLVVVPLSSFFIPIIIIMFIAISSIFLSLLVLVLFRNEDPKSGAPNPEPPHL